MSSRTAELVDAIARYRYEQLPPDVVQSAKSALIDALGALMAATNPDYPILAQLDRYGTLSGGTGASIYGTSLRTDPATAALLNGTLAYYCDIESHHPSANVHAIAVVGPAALALAEYRKSSGRELVSAIVGGIDVAVRVSYALGPAEMYARGLHPSTIAGTFGSTVAAGMLLGLDNEQFTNALGLAGTSTCGLLSWVDDPSEQSRPLNIGLSAQAGVQAALLAGQGFKGPIDILGGKYPFGPAFTGQWDHDALLDEIGQRYEVRNLFFKRNSCCVFIPAGLDGLTSILDENEIAPETIDRVEVRAPKSSYHVIDNNPLRSHCAQYVLAVAAYQGSVEFSDIMSDRRLEDDRIRALSERITVVGDPALDVAGEGQSVASTTTVVLKDGTTHRREVPDPLGSPANPLTDETLRSKFEALTAPIMTANRQQAIQDAVSAIEEMDDATRLTDLLTDHVAD
jgi:2-methylcitrate dehydratase PrpD